METFTAFCDEHRLASGRLDQLALVIRQTDQQVIVFSDETGAQIDLDLRGSDGDIVARYGAPPRRRGRPRLGVVAKEVTLLPQQWDWLQQQPGGASVALRCLVEASRRDSRSLARAAANAAYAFMSAMAGNRPGFEEAARALFAADGDRFRTLTRDWPTDIRDHARRLAAPALVGTTLGVVG
jgi:hypothetical protein